MSVLPIPVIWRQVPPEPAPYWIRGRPRTQNLKHRVHKPAVVLGRSSRLARFPGQMGLQVFPDPVRKSLART